MCGLNTSLQFLLRRGKTLFAMDSGRIIAQGPRLRMYVESTAFMKSVYGGACPMLSVHNLDRTVMDSFVPYQERAPSRSPQATLFTNWTPMAQANSTFSKPFAGCPCPFSSRAALSFLKTKTITGTPASSTRDSTRAYFTGCQRSDARLFSEMTVR